MTTEPNSFLTVSSKEAALLHQTAATLQIAIFIQILLIILILVAKSASCETKYVSGMTK